MEFPDVVRGRRMCRSFRPDPLERAVVDGLLALAQRAPSAGNTQGWQFLVLDEPATVARYWDSTLAPARRAAFPWPGLLRAPVLVVPYADPAAYVTRYGEPDKRRRVAAGPDERAALADEPDAWPLPYWLVDTAMATMTVLLGAVDAGLGACLFGQFEHEAAVRRAFAVPERFRAVGTIAVGRPDVGDRPSGSTRRRPRPSLEAVVHRGAWPDDRVGPDDRGEPAAEPS